MHRVDCRARISPDDLAALRAGDEVEVTGRLITLRDASAARLVAALADGEGAAPWLSGRIVYAMGPSPARPGHVVGSAGPTTTARLARFLPALFEAGVRAVIGKGELRGEQAAAFTRHGAVYLGAVGGLGALLAQHITAMSPVAWEELGPEAVYAVDVVAFPAVVIIDTTGRNFHEHARRAWRRTP